MSDIEFLSPLEFPPIPQAQPQPASARSGHTAPRIQGGELPGVPADLWFALERARDLFRIARSPHKDAMYPHIKVHMVTLARHLADKAKECPEDAEVAELLLEVRSYLPRSYSS